MARVTGVPISFLLSRGQSIKVTWQICSFRLSPTVWCILNWSNFKLKFSGTVSAFKESKTTEYGYSKCEAGWIWTGNVWGCNCKCSFFIIYACNLTINNDIHATSWSFETIISTKFWLVNLNRVMLHLWCILGSWHLVHALADSFQYFWSCRRKLILLSFCMLWIFRVSYQR